MPQLLKHAVLPSVHAQGLAEHCPFRSLLTDLQASGAAAQVNILASAAAAALHHTGVTLAAISKHMHSPAVCHPSAACAPPLLLLLYTVLA